MSIEEEEPQGGFGLQEIAAIFWRRRWWLVVPLVVATIAAGIYAWQADPVYESTATILIESQQIPTSLVASPTTSFADERIAKIRQQILARNTLVELINRNNLYPEERSSKQLSDVVALMRDAIKVDLVSANVDPSSGPMKGNATIAFNLTFAYDNPQITQKVAEQLMGMFIDADMRRRTEQASGTAGFLARRAEELRQRLLKQEEQITAVRQRYNGALPEQLAMSSSSAATLRGEISRIDAEIQGVMQANAVLAGRMQDQAAMPDNSVQGELQRAEANLDRVQALYADSHPDVVAAKDVVARLRQSAKAVGSRGGSALTAELNAGRARIAMLNQRRAELAGNIAAADRLVAVSPQAAYALNNLQRDYDNLNQQYQSIRDRQLEAQVAANLETEEKGERFTAVDPPAFPEKPVRPDRLKLVLMGIGAGAGMGLGLIMLIELLTAPIHGAGAVQRLTGDLPLAAIPVMKTGPLESSLSWFDRLVLWRRRLRAGA